MKRILLSVALLGSGCTVIGAATGAAVAEHPGHGAISGAVIGALVDMAVVVAVTSLSSSSSHRESKPTSTCLFYCVSNQD